tara:strand:- start:5779 stop:8013 length:2235 start_codon:yes stop_codon:yes gene_type:complete
MFRKIGRENIIFIVLILLLTAVFLHSIISTTKIMDNIHHINDVTFISENLKQSLFEYGQLNLWTPYYYSGRPLYAQPEYYFLGFNFLYILLFKNIFIAMNLTTLTYFFLSGLGMYFLFLTFKDNKKAAFIAAVVYMFNGYIHSFVISGNLNVLAGYSLIPFAFMFFVKALKSKNFAKYSILSGLFIALQLFVGGTLLIPYEIVLFAIYSAFYLLGKNLGGKLLKIAAVGILIILVSFGVSAIKLLPGLEFMSLSNRGSGISYQEYLGHPIEISNMIHVVVTNLVSKGISASVGIMGFILLIFSLYNYKKKYVMFSLALLIFSILMAMKGPVADLFFKFPIFSQLRHIERAVFLTAFASSILAGIGFTVFSEKVKRIIKVNKDIIIFSGIVLLILIELLFLQNFPSGIEITNPKEMPINNYISEDTGTFRTINLALSTLVGATGYNYLAQLGISELKGGGGIWFNDYLQYLSVAQQTNPTRLWGMLNNKYVISDKELDIPQLEFIDKFRECKDCTIWEAYGPYLYENLEFMPRAYLVSKSILVVGSKQNTVQIVYSLILNNNFDPKKVVIVEKESINSNDLEKYDAIIPSGTIENNEINNLRNYVDKGGILLPNIFEDKNSIGEKDIQNLLDSLNGNFEEIEILEYESNGATYNVNNKKGFLVLSERFSNFPGWDATGKSKKEILKANVITTAVFVENEEKITFKYKPQSFKNGSIISSITALLIIIYFLFSYVKNRGGKNKARP